MVYNFVINIVYLKTDSKVLHFRIQGVQKEEIGTVALRKATSQDHDSLTPTKKTSMNGAGYRL